MSARAGVYNEHHPYVVDHDNRPGLTPPEIRAELRSVQPKTVVPDDPTCVACGELPRHLTCRGCGVSAFVTNCGHFDQPRPIAAGRSDGSELERDYCETCARVDDLDVQLDDKAPPP